LAIVIVGEKIISNVQLNIKLIILSKNINIIERISNNVNDDLNKNDNNRGINTILKEIYTSGINNLYKLFVLISILYYNIKYNI